jgi:hypothetical protein
MLGKHNPGKNPELLKSSRLLSFSKVPGFFRDCVCRAFPEKIRNFARIIQLCGVIFQHDSTVELFGSSCFLQGLSLRKFRFFQNCAANTISEKTELPKDSATGHF